MAIGDPWERAIGRFYGCFASIASGLTLKEELGRRSGIPDCRNASGVGNRKGRWSWQRTAADAWGAAHDRRRLPLGSREAFPEPSLHRRPLVVQDRVVDGVAQVPIGHPDVLAQRALANRAEALDGGL